MNNKLILLVSGMSCLLFVNCKQKETQLKETDTAIPVKSALVTHQSGQISDTYIGIVEASHSVPLSFLSPGTIEQVYVEEGDHVNKGQLLASLNDRSYQSALQLAMAKEKQARDAYVRLEEVYKKGSLPEVKMIEIETGLEQAVSAVQIARKNLEDCKLYAPTSGTIGKRSAEPGMNFIPGSPVLTLIDIQNVHVKISVPEKEIAGIRENQKATVEVPALQNRTFAGKVEQKGVIANLLSHSYDAKISVSNPKEELKPGMICNVSLTGQSTEDLLLVPQYIIQVDPNGNKYVFVVEANSGRAVKKIVKTGKIWGYGDIEIVDGLQVNDRVITEGYHKISENTPVKTVQ